MARKSRVNVANKVAEPAPYYRVGVYARVSKEENQYSNTIEVQDGMGREFISAHRDMQYVKCYADINISSFASVRPAFEEMIADIQAGKINCVIVKDISRFGRHYIQTMEYISEVFPRMGVRFVSLIERYDSINDTSKNSLKLPMLSIVNYYYSADLSQKVKSTVGLKQRTGTYLPPSVPFGYQKKCVGHEMILKINEAEALIVKRIFQSCIEGQTIYAIVKKLNEDNECQRVWTQSFVSRLLRNPFYKGTYSAGKTKKLFDSSLVFRKAPDDWIKFENHHESIISTAMFDKVQNYLLKNKQHPKPRNFKPNDSFSDKVYCAYCGKKMRRIVQHTSTGNESVSYVCSTFLGTAGVRCERNAISEKRLKTEVIRQMNLKVEKAKQIQTQRLQYEESFAFREWLQFREKRLQEMKQRVLELENIELTVKLYELAKDNMGYYHVDYAYISQLRADEKKYLNEKIFKTNEEIEQYWKSGSSKAEELQRFLLWSVQNFWGNKMQIPDIKSIVLSFQSVLLNFVYNPQDNGWDKSRKGDCHDYTRENHRKTSQQRNIF